MFKCRIYHPKKDLKMKLSLYELESYEQLSDDIKSEIKEKNYHCEIGLSSSSAKDIPDMIEDYNNHVLTADNSSCSFMAVMPGDVVQNFNKPDEVYYMNNNYKLSRINNFFD